MERTAKFVIWRPPTRREACQCTECPSSVEHGGCPQRQTIWEAWPWWSLTWWLPRRAVCAVVGHKQWFRLPGSKTKHKLQHCDRCWCRPITVEMVSTLDQNVNDP